MTAERRMTKVQCGELSRCPVVEFPILKRLVEIQ